VMQYANMFGMNDVDTAAQMGFSVLAAGQDRLQRNFMTNALPSLKHHFNVSNSYVLQKLRIVLFPWGHKPWGRRTVRASAGEGSQSTEYQPPREDINSPDLYIPSMALVTYVLLSAVQSGLNGNFTPEILGTSCYKALAVVLLEFLFVKLGCYLLNIAGTSTVVDLVSYGGYKFVGIMPVLLASLMGLRPSFYWPIFLYSFSATAFFLLRSLRHIVLPDPHTSGARTLSQAQRGRRISFLFIVAVTQIMYLFILSPA